MAKKKQGMSPTFKAGLIVIVVVFLVWGVISSQEDAFYKNSDKQTQVVETTNPIDVAKTTETKVVIEPKSDESVVTPEVDKPTEEAVVELIDEAKPVIIQKPEGDFTNDSFNYEVDPMTITDEAKYWSFKRNTDHTPVQGYNEGVPIEDYDALYLGDTEEKVVYLTFDEGYELEYTGRILDTLRDNDVKAAFFVTEPYVLAEPELVKRMKDEGHVVGNHSVHHYDGSTTVEKYSQLSVEDTVAELSGVADAMLEQTGYPIDRFFRPPGGLFSERSLYITRQQGYKTVFWSMAHQDWYVDNQPGKQASYDHVMTNYHPGAVILLHAVSQSNTEALDDILKALKAEGYRFGSLYEIPSNF